MLPTRKWTSNPTVNDINMRPQTPFLSRATRPSGRLFPPEIMALVLYMVLDNYDDEHDEENLIDRKVEAETILRASQVCKYWRNVALACTCIWGKLIDADFIGEHWTKELIKRSNSAPLVIRSTCTLDSLPDRFTKSKWRAILHEIHRVRVLSVGFNLGHDITFPLVNVLLQSAPSLESCRLIDTIVSEDRNPGIAIDGLSGVRIFNGTAPKLRCLVLHGAVLPLFADFSRLNLTHLELSFEHTSVNFTLSRWLDILAEQPLLAFLTLTGFSLDHFTSSGTPPELRQVTLPHLTSLYLAADIVDCGDLFGSLVPPPTSYIHLNLEQKTLNSSIRGLQAGLKGVLRNWEKHHDCQCYQWQIETDPDDSFHINIGQGELEKNFFWAQLTIEYNIDANVADVISDDTITFRYPFQDFLHLFRNVHLLERESIMGLGLGSFRPVSPGTLVSFLSAFNKVSKLIISGEWADNMLKMILQATSAPPHPAGQSGALEEVDDGATALFPDLQCAALDCPATGAENCIETFRDYLEWRHSLGKRVPKAVVLHEPGAFDMVQPPTDPKDYFADALEILEGIDLGEPVPPCCSYCDCC